MPKEKGDEWKHVTVVEKTTGSGGAASHPKVKCAIISFRFAFNCLHDYE